MVNKPLPEPQRIVAVSLSYPRQPGEADTIDLDLEDVRAARSIRVQYDFERDGYVIGAQRDPGRSGPDAGCLDDDERFFEVAFVPAWAPDPQQPPGGASDPTSPATVLEQAVAVIEQATAEPMGLPFVGARRASPDSPRTLLIGSEQDAAEAFGEDSDLHRHVRSFFARPRGEPLVLVPLEPEDRDG